MIGFGRRKQQRPAATANKTRTFLKPTLPAEATESAFAKFQALSRTEQFATVRDISGNGVGGVAAPIALSDIPAAARTKISKDVAEFVQEYEWDGREIDLSYEKITVDDNGTSKTIGTAHSLRWPTLVATTSAGTTSSIRKAPC